MKPIRVNSAFATPYDTARILGVSRARTEELIKLARRNGDQSAKAADSIDRASKSHSIKKSSTSVARKSRVRNAGTRASNTKTKTVKANH